MQLYHNAIRPYQRLDGKTPIDVCEIKAKGENKWLTAIQNAKKEELKLFQQVSQS